MPRYRDLTYIGPPNHYGDYETSKRLVVVHCTANTASARDEASYATRRSDSVSSHYYVDDQELIQSLNTDLVAWHAGNAEGNQRGISYEFTGHTSWSRAKWLASVDWAAAGAQMARDCQRWGIPARWLTVDQLKAGWRGLTTHNDVRRAWGGTHTDPGPGFPEDVLLDAIRDAMNGDDDMPIRTSLGLSQDQPLLWGEFTAIRWDREHGDPDDAHADDGAYPSYIPDHTSWVDAQAQVRIDGMAPGDEVQVRYELHDWAGGKSAGKWTEIVVDRLATGGNQYITATVSKHVETGQRLRVAVKPIPGSGAGERPAPVAVSGRWTLRQDRS